MADGKPDIEVTESSVRSEYLLQFKGILYEQEQKGFANGALPGVTIAYCHLFREKTWRPYGHPEL